MQSRSSCARGATRSLGVLLVPLLVVLLALPAVAALGNGEDGRPAIWEGRAATSGVQVVLNTDPPLLPLADFIRFEIPEGDSRWDSSGGAEARASSIYPGGGVTGGPNLMCMEFFPCPDGFPPDYPLSAVAAYPVQPEAQTQDGLARAEANRERVRTDAALTSFPGLEAFEAAFTVEAVEARTLQRFEDGVLVVRSRSRVTGLEFGGGVVRIDEVFAQSVVRTDGEATQDIDTTVRVTGVTVADQPAELGEDGIVIVGQGDDRQLFDGAQEALDAFAEQTGFEIALVGAQEGADEASAIGRAVGLSVSMRIPVDGPEVPNPFPPEFPLTPDAGYRDYLLDITVARAVAQARVDDFELGDLGDLADLSDLTDDAAPAAPVPPAPGFDGGTADVALGSPAPSTADSSDHPTAAAPDEAVAAGEPHPELLLGGEVAEAVTQLYAGLALLAFTLLGASRIGSAARFIRPGG